MTYNDYDDPEEDYRYKEYSPNIFKALHPLVQHLAEEEQEMAARRVIRYLELVIEQVDEEEGCE